MMNLVVPQVPYEEKERERDYFAALGRVASNVIDIFTTAWLLDNLCVILRVITGAS